MAKAIAKYPLEGGMGNVGSVTATATAFQAATDGYENGQPSSLVMTHGYLVIVLVRSYTVYISILTYASIKSWNSFGARKAATNVPRP